MTLFVFSNPLNLGLDNRVDGTKWNTLVGAFNGNNSEDLTIKGQVLQGASSLLRLGTDSRIYYDDSGTGFINRNAPLTIRRVLTSAPTTVYPSISVIQTSYGNNGTSFIGAGGLFIKTQDTGTAATRGVLTCIQCVVNPTTENYPYTVNRDSTPLLLSNTGTVMASDCVYIGSTTELNTP